MKDKKIPNFKLNQPRIWNFGTCNYFVLVSSASRAIATIVESTFTATIAVSTTITAI